MCPAVSKLPIRLNALPNEVAVFLWLLSASLEQWVASLPVLLLHYASLSLCKLAHWATFWCQATYAVSTSSIQSHKMSWLLFVGFLFLLPYLPKHSSSSHPSPSQIPPIQGTQRFSFLWNLDSQGFLLHRLVEVFSWSPDWVAFHSLHWLVSSLPAVLLRLTTSASLQAVGPSNRTEHPTVGQLLLMSSLQPGTFIIAFLYPAKLADYPLCILRG